MRTVAEPTSGAGRGEQRKEVLVFLHRGVPQISGDNLTPIRLWHWHRRRERRKPGSLVQYSLPCEAFAVWTARVLRAMLRAPNSVGARPEPAGAGGAGTAGASASDAAAAGAGAHLLAPELFSCPPRLAYPETFPASTLPEDKARLACRPGAAGTDRRARGRHVVALSKRQCLPVLDCALDQPGP